MEEKPINKQLNPRVWFWIPALISTLIFLIAPEDVLTQFPFLNEVVGFLSKIDPSIEAWRQFSIMPEKTALIVSWNCLAMPYIFFFYVKFYKNPLNDDEKIKKILVTHNKFYKLSTLKRLLYLVFACGLFVLLLWGSYGFVESPNCSRFCVRQSQARLWIGSIIFMYSIPLVLGVLIVIVSNFKKLLLLKFDTKY